MKSLSMPLMLTIKDAAKALGFDRQVVSRMCASGELPFVPCLTPEGKRSRLHKRIPVASVEDWIRRNTIRTQEDFRRAVDGRRGS